VLPAENIRGWSWEFTTDMGYWQEKWIIFNLVIALLPELQQ